MLIFFFFFFNDTAPTEIYTLSLHDALPIFVPRIVPPRGSRPDISRGPSGSKMPSDRKSTRLNSSHVKISYAVFCLKKKKKKKNIHTINQNHRQNNKKIKQSDNLNKHNRK